MSLSHSPKIVTDGLVFAYDMGNPNKSWIGQPTTNLVGDGMSIYNNVPSDVSVTLTATNEKYKGATVYKQVIKPITTTGVSYLTNGNNPGIGVVSSGGGGTASRYTGHAIYYKPTTAMHSTPLFTNYSNIGGWGAGSLGSNRSVAMGDGWYRGEVIWYDTVTRSDGKYWAINPANAGLNVPITVYWAGPFKEDRNDSTMVAQYTTGTRSNTQAIIDLVGNNTITASNLTYNSDGTFSFNNSSSVMTLPDNPVLNMTSGLSIEAWVKFNGDSDDFIFEKGDVNTQYSLFSHSTDIVFRTYHAADGTYHTQNPSKSAVGVSNGVPVHIVGSWDGSTKQIYINGVLKDSVAKTGALITRNTGAAVGRFGGTSSGYYFGGDIYKIAVYNRGLSAAEVKQNFNALRGRYGL